MTTDHISEALDRLPEQHRSDPNLIALLTALTRPVQTLEDTMRELLTLRTVDTATDAALDAIGKLVGQGRIGLDDDTYRRYIRARIKTNRSNGRVEDLIRIAVLLIDDLDARIVIDQQGVAAVVVRIEEVAISTDIADAVIMFLAKAVAAGVRIILETASGTPTVMFAFDGGVSSLGYGTAARINLAPLTANVDTVVRLRTPGVAGNSYTLALVHNGAAPGAGTLTNVGTAYTFTFLGGTTTVAQFETAINASSVFHVLTVDGVGTMATPGDVIAATALSGGIDGGILAGARD